jgi:ABC-2 type transport system ATP-binding protein
VTLAELDAVTKRFGAVVALDHVSLAIEAGSTVALLGPNGAGKSTLASIVLGLRTPDAGRVRVAGRDPRDHRARHALAAMPQETVFPQTLRVAELAAFVAAHYRAPAPVQDVLAEFGLEALAARQAGGLSVGQRRRLALALAFVGRPDLIVLDEPTAALDGEGRRTVWAAVRAARDRGATVLVATHQLDEADAVATRVIAIDRGRVVADGPPAEVKRRAGGARIHYRNTAAGSTDDEWITVAAVDAGAEVRRLVLSGERLEDLEVRPLTLEEALDALGGRS